MPRSKKSIKVKGGTNKASVIQSIESSEEELRELYFKDLVLFIQPHTFDVICEVKKTAEVDISRAISFILDAGGVLFGALKEGMIEKIREQIKKK